MATSFDNLGKRLIKVEATHTPSDTPLIDWTPTPGPQAMAYESTADVVGFGGSAGGGKTDLAVGKALTKHQRVLIMRREATQLTGIIDRFRELLGGTDGYNGSEKVWRLPGRQIEFGSCPNLLDEQRYQGRAHDLLIFDESTHFAESQVRYLLGWLRSADADQRCQVIMTMNPPQSTEGAWVREYFAPWVDPKHHNPAESGEIRWFVRLAGREVEVESGEPFDYEGEIVKPQSRTFIHARLKDNPYLRDTGYMAQLQAMPEPLRSQLLYGDFTAGVQDDPMQAIPSAWIDAAMERWRPRNPKGLMVSLGCDVARGGADQTVIARRHEGMWFDVPLVYPGSATPDGPTVAGLVLSALRNRAPVHIDVIGVGSSPYDFLRTGTSHTIVGVNVSESATAFDQSGRLRFKNQRSELVWRMREALDPTNDTGIALPPDKRLRADLASYTWEMQGVTVYVHSREQVFKRIGRSPDWASAFILALIDTPTWDDFHSDHGAKDRQAVLNYNAVSAMERR
jgi:hypothetical protein